MFFRVALKKFILVIWSSIIVNESVNSEPSNNGSESDLVEISIAKLKAWQILTSENRVPKSLDNYLIYFEETLSEIKVYFKKKDQGQKLGGGMGMYIVKKGTNEVISSGLAK